MRRLKILLLILLAVSLVSPGLVEAKRYVWGYGHLVAVYDPEDLPSYFRPYINRIEFDLVCERGAGVRLYLKRAPMSVVVNILAPPFTDFIMTRPEWNKNSDRPRQSIIEEIKWHWPKIVTVGVVDIEYYCVDLKWYEIPLYGCQKYR